MSVIEIEKVFAFVNAVRRTRSLPPLHCIPIEGAMPFDPLECLLARATGCFVDVEVLRFRTSREAARAAAVTRMERVGPRSIRLPEYVLEAMVAFDQGLLSEDLVANGRCRVPGTMQIAA